VRQALAGFAIITLLSAAIHAADGPAVAGQTGTAAPSKAEAAVQRPLVPLTLTPDDLRQIYNWQAEQPYQTGKALEPVMNFLWAKEQAAQGDAAKTEKKK
jgi:hypothetical protein